jgi:hypothetical protein
VPNNDAEALVRGEQPLHANAFTHTGVRNDKHADEIAFAYANQDMVATRMRGDAPIG